MSVPAALRPAVGGGDPAAAPSPNRAWHRPPTIIPNYGHRRGLTQSSSVPRVLLHDNVSQQQMLDARLSHLATEERRARRLLELHKKSFLTRQSHKQQQLRAIGVEHISIIPDVVAEAHCNMSRFGSHGDASPSNRQSPARQVNNSTVMTGNNGASPSNHRRVASSPLKNDARVTSEYRDGDVITITDGLTIEEIHADIANSGRLGGGLVGDGGGGDRTRSAVAKSEKTFMTHDYRLQRGKTYAGDVTPGSGVTIRGASGRARIIRDPRFTSLRKSLVPNSRPMEGFIHLSPSGRTVIQQYGTPLFDLDLLDSCIRQYPPRPPTEGATHLPLLRMRSNGAARRGSAASNVSSGDGNYSNGYLGDAEDVGTDDRGRNHRRVNRLVVNNSNGRHDDGQDNHDNV